jgi:hypothetical protein
MLKMNCRCGTCKNILDLRYYKELGCNAYQRRTCSEFPNCSTNCDCHEKHGSAKTHELDRVLKCITGSSDKQDFDAFTDDREIQKNITEYFDGFGKSRCICTQRIETMNVIQNKKTKDVFIIGSVCIQKFSPEIYTKIHGQCDVCGKMLNMVFHFSKQHFVCSSECYDKLSGPNKECKQDHNYCSLCGRRNIVMVDQICKLCFDMHKKCKICPNFIPKKATKHVHKHDVCSPICYSLLKEPKSPCDECNKLCKTCEQCNIPKILATEDHCAHCKETFNQCFSCEKFRVSKAEANPEANCANCIANYSKCKQCERLKIYKVFASKHVYEHGVCSAKCYAEQFSYVDRSCHVCNEACQTCGNKYIAKYTYHDLKETHCKICVTCHRMCEQCGLYRIKQTSPAHYRYCKTCIGLVYKRKREE